MKNILAIVLVVLCALPTSAEALTAKYDQLDAELAKRDMYVNAKLDRIDSLRSLFYAATTPERELELSMLISEQYLLLRADSAMAYSQFAEKIAEELGRKDVLNAIYIRQSMAFATSGFFEEAENNLKSVDTAILTEATKVKYYEQYVQFYNWLMAFGTMRDADQIRAAMKACADSIVALLPADSGIGLYWQGEVSKFQGNYDAAEKAYRSALAKLGMDERYYASASCALALIYQEQKRYDECEEWFINSAISDQKCAIKENYSLQAISDFLVNVRGEEERANTYISYALADAIYYNNRLRLTEIAKKFPNVVYRYQETEKQALRRMTVINFIIILLAVGLLAAIWLTYKQTQRLRKSQKTLHLMYQELTDVNKQLKTTNLKREKYASLFIELSASYMDKYANLIKTIERKIKVKQTDDLLVTLHANRISDADAKEFYFNFDSAFLELYPTFVSEFNNLLQPEYRIVPKKGEKLSGELRIFALIRLGINDTQQLSTLLFYSTRTIYNYRSVTKQHALSPNDFDDQVMKICAYT